MARCLVHLERAQDARDEADQLVTFCEQNNYRNLLWRVLALRAQAHARLGGATDAQRDYEGAAAVVAELSEHVPSDALRAAFLSQAAAKDILAATRSNR